MVDADGFQVVKKRKGYKNKFCQDNHRTSTKTWSKLSSSEIVHFDVNELKSKIVKCRYEKLSFSHSFYNLFRLDTFDDSCSRKNSISKEESGSKNTAVIQEEPIADIICYGIGKITTCPIARYQFALLLLLKEQLQIAGPCHIYEPHFSEDDKMIVEKLGCQLIEHNEEGKRKVERLTLFFMLHCGKPLYNSVLWANWGPRLSNVIILGNRFSSYQERIPSRQLRSEASFIYNILPYVKETPVPNTFHHSDIFNDSAIHWFPRDILSIHLTVW
ncbi:unnamed protein product, partial [Porites evermanni]